MSPIAAISAISGALSDFCIWYITSSASSAARVPTAIFDWIPLCIASDIVSRSMVGITYKLSSLYFMLRWISRILSYPSSCSTGSLSFRKRLSWNVIIGRFLSLNPWYHKTPFILPIFSFFIRTKFSPVEIHDVTEEAPTARGISPMGYPSFLLSFFANVINGENPPPPSGWEATSHFPKPFSSRTFRSSGSSYLPRAQPAALLWPAIRYTSPTVTWLILSFSRRLTIVSPSPDIPSISIL